MTLKLKLLSVDSDRAGSSVRATYDLCRKPQKMFLLPFQINPVAVFLEGMLFEYSCVSSRDTGRLQYPVHHGEKQASKSTATMILRPRLRTGWCLTM